LSYLRGLQDTICDTLEQTDGTAHFRSDSWQRAEGGGGSRLVLRDSAVFEQAGVNFSHVMGAKLPASASAQRPELQDAQWLAAGVSLVLHPLNPYVPTTHCNVRFFCATKQQTVAWWFGGGFDLTPYYPFDEDVLHWHRTAQQACAPFGDDVYERHKDWCDRYFFLKHRNETRGVGGLFFDDLNEWGFDRCFAYQRSVADHLLPAYLPIVARVRRRVLGRSHRGGLRPLLRLPAQRRRSLPAGVSADRRASPCDVVRRARAPLPVVSPWALCRIQSRVRPRHFVRSAERRPHRID